MEDRIYLTVAKNLEDDIISGAVREGDAAPSTNALAERFGINPATAAKGVSRLSDEGYLTKRRGIGLFVVPGARDAILEHRRREFREVLLRALLDEAHKLSISRRDMVAMIMAME